MVPCSFHGLCLSPCPTRGGRRPRQVGPACRWLIEGRGGGLGQTREMGRQSELGRRGEEKERKGRGERGFGLGWKEKGEGDMFYIFFGN